MQEAYRAADAVIDGLKRQGEDYSSKRDAIANFYQSYLWHGNWDGVLQLEDPTLSDLRFVQEDEYDQHMDDEDPNENPDYLGFWAAHYVFRA